MESKKIHLRIVGKGRCQNVVGYVRGETKEKALAWFLYNAPYFEYSSVEGIDSSDYPSPSV